METETFKEYIAGIEKQQKRDAITGLIIVFMSVMALFAIIL